MAPTHFDNEEDWAAFAAGGRLSARPDAPGQQPADDAGSASRSRLKWSASIIVVAIAGAALTYQYLI